MAVRRAAVVDLRVNIFFGCWFEILWEVGLFGFVKASIVWDV